MAINNGRYVITGGFREPDGTIVEERQRVPGATTDGRYVITGGFREPDGTIVEERQRVPNQTVVANDGLPHFHTQSTEFSPAEVYRLRADGYYNQGDTVLGDAYKALREGNNAYSNTANQINDFYSQLGQDVYRREMALAGQKEALANKLAQDMGQTRQYALDMFGPNGELTREVNKYYDDLGNYLATDAGRQAATIAAQGMHSGASLGAIRAQQNQAYNESFARYVQAKEQEINAKQQIASNLINYMSTLRQEYGDTTNQYIIQQYQRANDLLNSLSQNIANSNVQLAQTKLNASLGGGKSNNNGYSYLDALTQAYLMEELGLTDDTENSGIHSDDNLNS